MSPEYHEIEYCVVKNPHEDTSPLKSNEEFLYIKHSLHHRSNGIAAILSKPKSLQFSTLGEQVKNQGTYLLPMHKLVLLLHGHQSHKNSNYQGALADKLSENGYYVMRIDFRGLGDSEESADPELGRTVEQDVNDVHSVFQFTTSDACKQLIGYKLTLDTIVAHSRGVVAMFQFARRYHVPNLVNCCGRYDSSGLLIRTAKQNPGWDQDKGYYCRALRKGSWQKLWIPQTETMSAGTIDTSKFAQIDKKSWVMSVYCSADAVIPASAASDYANLFHGRHTLEIIPYADHNFYGAPGDLNTLGLPLKRGRISYHTVLVDKIAAHLGNVQQAQRFYELHLEIEAPKEIPHIIQRWPLPYISSGISNFRDIGGYLTTSGFRVKHGLIYRSSNPSGAAAAVIDYMVSNLHIGKVYYLCSAIGPQDPRIINGIDTETLYLKGEHNMPPEQSFDHYQSLFISPYFHHKAYKHILQGIDGIQSFFRSLINHKLCCRNAVLICCSTGKDTTGVLTMLILGILGVDPDTIAREFELSTFGIPKDDLLLERIRSYTSNFLELLGPNGPIIAKEFNLTPSSTIIHLLSSPYETMRLFIDIFLEEHNSFENYFTKTLKFSPNNINTLRNQLLE
ncbi:uncharacterized protein Ecym_2784 [Eremothecium cymbalariae DBVPG|uniref:Serine aminopeptidase S33 domain-containing protein n=1 Tax=Eremothecium cymbalariae (strain CBS 270.75 / DBVPG 7215 / KCTC 17166 / NRRL Y-17582) TaxID=931890 RepID=G8JQ19_ERECY|nr:Hypothetical protein Ecym_2784 [Eremothecium cymbalariae DBVPG\